MVGPRTCHNPHRNPPPGGADEPARGLPRASTKSSNIPTLSLAVFWIPTFALVLALVPTLFSTNELLKQFMTGY